MLQIKLGVTQTRMTPSCLQSKAGGARNPLSRYVKLVG
jgi:hypothetical protein